MIKTLLVTSGLALTALFSHAATSHSDAATANVSTKHLSKWQWAKSEFKGEKAPDSSQVNQHDKLLKIVKKYAPDSLDKWKEAIAKRNDLLSQLKSDEIKQLRKENRQSLKSELREKVKSGELSKKEAHQQFRSHFQHLKDKHQQNVEARKEWKAQLKTAIEKNDSETIKTILNNYYQHFVSKNDIITQKIENWKTGTTSTQSTSSNEGDSQNSL